MLRQTLSLYRAMQVRELDRSAMEDHGVPGMTLMERAGAAAFAEMRRRWPIRRKIAVLCGVGNNAGDGYILARLALAAGLKVTVISIGKLDRLRGDAKTAWENLSASGVATEVFNAQDLSGFELIVDGLLGIGFTGELRGAWLEAVTAVNIAARGGVPVLALDIPSGLDADTGHAASGAVNANVTLTFIGRKQGLFTADGPEHSGEIVFSDLGVPPGIYEFDMPSAELLAMETFGDLLPSRAKNSHKGDYGHVIVVAGNRGYLGAARLAGEAALRVGAGRVTVVTRIEHAPILAAQRPELICRGFESAQALRALISADDVLVVGPGLGQDHWARQMWEAVLDYPNLRVVDADALNLLALQPRILDHNSILTPHPGEAARLLGSSTAMVQADRFQCVAGLQEKYQANVILKGSGSLVRTAAGRDYVCPCGNPGMATAGMGDVLAGVLGGLLAQGLSTADAACLGTMAHALAGDLAAAAGQRGCLASDLFPFLRTLLNGH